MAAVVNQLRFKDPVDPALFEQAERELTPRMRAIEGFEEFFVVQTSDTEVTLVIVGADEAVLDRVATEVGSPWMAANVVPLLAAPPERRLGATIASSRRVGPTIDQLNLVVGDMDATLAFYRRLGVDVRPIPAAWDAWAPHHRNGILAGGLGVDFDSPAFARQWDEGWPGPGAGSTVLGFRVASRQAVDETYADLTGAGYTGQQPPYDAFWGARYAVVEDPDGRPVGIMSAVDGAHRTPPPAPPGG